MSSLPVSSATSSLRFNYKRLSSETRSGSKSREPLTLPSSLVSLPIRGYDFSQRSSRSNLARIPHNLELRAYQLPAWEALFERQCRRIISIWHRRAGKSKTHFCMLAKHAAEVRVGNYFYIFPTYTQGRKACWNNIDAAGFRMIEHVPREWLARDPNNSEMLLTFRNGSTLQIIGASADKQGRGIDSIRGSNPVGVGYSEYALMVPRVWDVIRPILAENGGFALFDYTPMGKNHAFDLYSAAQENAAWFTSLLTVDDTRRPDGSPVISPEAIDEDRKSGMSEDMVQQEYYCSFNAAIRGAYYGKLLEEAERDGRVLDLPVDNVPVYTSWDLGRSDNTAIWFWQQCGPWRHYIDYYESHHQPLQHYAKVLQERGYLYGCHYLPHDIQVTDYTANQTRLEILRDFKIGRCQVVPQHSVDDRIDASRGALPKCRFDRRRTEAGRKALAHYHTEYDESRQTFRNQPEHDWSSHGADAFGYGVVGHRERGAIPGAVVGPSF